MENDPVAEADKDTLEMMMVVGDQEEVTDRGADESDKEIDQISANSLPLAPTRIRRTYSCGGKCKFNTKNPREYLYHRRDDHHENVQIFECPHCVYASKQPQKLERHVQYVHKSLLRELDNNPPISPEPLEKQANGEDKKMTTRSSNRRPVGCGEVSFTESDQSFLEDKMLEGENSSLEYDLNEQHKENRILKKKFFCCSQCDYVTNEKIKYQKHIRCHSLPTLKCDICQFSTSNKWHMDRHMKNHNQNTGQYKCDMCNYSTHTRHSVAVHREWHHGDRKMDGEMPSDGFDPELSEEMETFKSIENGAAEQLHVIIEKDSTETPSHVESKKFSCRLCNTGFANSSNLSRHMNTVHRAAAKGKNLLSVLQKIQKSPQDGNSESNGVEDEEITSNEKAPAKPDDETHSLIGGTAKEPFCKKCGYKAKWVSELEKHIRVHTQEKPFPCLYCSHSARWKGDLTRHIQKIHPAKLDEFYEISGINKRKTRVPKPHPVQYIEGNNNKMVFPGMQQPDHSDSEMSYDDDADADKSDDDDGDGTEFVDDEVMPETKVLAENTNTNLPPSSPEKSFNLPQNNSDNSISITNISDSQSSNNNNKSVGGGMTVLKKVKRYMYKCLSCEFVSRTASRFHVHIVQHLNKRPYMCSDCGYRSNWEWDITKHIKMKTQKLENHTAAKVLLIDEAGRKNYEKYNKYRIEVEDEIAVDQLPAFEASKLNKVDTASPAKSNCSEKLDLKSPIKVIYKCKTCDHKDSSKRAVITHIISHLQQYIIPGCGITDTKMLDDAGVMNDPYSAKTDHGGEVYICKICPYKSRKNFYIDFHVKQHQQRPGANYKCHFCPYWVNFRKTLLKHLKLHVLNPPTYLREVESLLVIETPVNKDKPEPLMPKPLNSNEVPKLNLSVITAKPSQQVAAPVSPKKEPVQMASPQTPGYVSISPVSSEPQKRSNDKKKFFCEHCPYESDNRTQYLYHKQFHRPNRPAAHKCRFCSYSVSHLHLLRQHMKVHAIAGNGSSLSSDGDSLEKKNSVTDRAESVASAVNRSFEALTSVSVNRHSELSLGQSSIPSVLIKHGSEMVKMFKCRYCPLVNKRRANVRVHEQMHTKGSQAKFVCPLCNYQCNNQGVLTAHIKIHQSTEVDSFAAIEQEKEVPAVTVTEQSSMLPQIIKQPSNVPPHLLVSMPMPRPKYRAQNYRCTKCPGIFKTQGDLDNHLKFHGINLPFRCHVCDYAARCKPHLHNHLRVHNDNNLSKLSDQDPDLSESSPSIGSPFLPSSTSSPSVTITAMPSKRPGFANPEQNALLVEEANACNAQLNGLPGNIPCTLCPAKFKATYLMQFHKALHGSGGNFRCSRCSYAVSTAKNINFHTKLHSGPTAPATVSLQPLKPYRCPKCPAMFNKVARFHRHVSLHGVKNRYRCDQCDYSVRYAANLIKHKQVHHQNVTPTHRFDENDQVTISPVTTKSMEQQSKSNPIMFEGSPIRFVQGKSSQQKPSTPFQQQQQNKEWLQESVYHVIAEDIDPKTRIFRCDRCPYIHGRKDAVQNHLRRHVAYQGLCCPHCDYYTMHMCFMRDHMKLHFRQGSWMKQHNYSVYDGLEITATSVATGEKMLVFRDNGKDAEKDHYEPQIPDEPCGILEANTPIESLQVKQETMDLNDSIIPHQEFALENYPDPSLQRFNGLSMVPSNVIFSEPLSRGRTPDFVKHRQDWFDGEGPVPARDYVQAMQNVENLGFEDVLHAIDKFMKDDYVPVKDKGEDNEMEVDNDASQN